MVRNTSRRWLAATLAAAAAVLVQTSAHAQTAPPHVDELVVFVGGLGSTPASTTANFQPLMRELLSRHLAVRPFAYSGSSCESIDTAAVELAGFVAALRDQHAAAHVIVVGHSNGGVLALEALRTEPDLAPFLERVVAVDAPLGGIKLADAYTYGATYGSCPAADELYARSSTAGWSDYLGQLEQWERSQGTDVRIVANPSDRAVSLAEQQIPTAPGSYTLDALDPADWTNHAAVLHAADVVAQLASIVSGQP